MASIPLPALDIRPQQPNDALGSFQKLAALRGMQLQQQSAQQEQQLRQQQIQDQQATTAAMKSWDGKDYDSLAKSVLDNGGSANAATAIQQHGLAVKKTVSDIAAQDATTGSKNLETFIGKHKAIGDSLEGIENVPDDQLHDTAAQKVQELTKAGIMDAPTAQQAMQAIQSTPDPQALRSHIDVFAKASLGAKAAAEQAKTESETAASNAKAGLDKANTFLANNKADIINNYKQNPQQLLSQVDAIAPPQGPNAALNARTKSQIHMALMNGDVDGAKDALKQASEQVGGVEKDVNAAKATQPLKIATAQAEGQSRQLVEGLEKPVYALDPQSGKPTLMSATDALKSGIRTMLPVSAKEVSDDTKLINRLGDVHQKIAEYEDALQKPVNSKDQSNIAALLGTTETKAGIHPGGIFGGVSLEIPMERVDAALNKENISGLSANARDQLIAYRNAREAMMGYKTVLSGSSRGSDKSMDLLTQALPDPSTTDPDFSARSLKAFKENLGVVGQGLPRIPGVKSPEEVEAQIKNGNSTSNSTTPAKTKASKYGVEIQ